MEWLLRLLGYKKDILEIGGRYRLRVNGKIPQYLYDLRKTQPSITVVCWRKK